MRVISPQGRLSLRKFVLFVAALAVTVFSYPLLIQTPVYAAGDASWSGDSLLYENNRYVGPTESTGNESHGIAQGASLYQRVSETDGSQAQTAHVIYFDPGVDPSTATSAKYVEYVFTPPSTYAQPSQRQDITVDDNTYGQGVTSCAVDGVGWLVCNLSVALAQGMDWIFDILKQFVEVHPLGFGTDNDLYHAWDIMRGVANIAFVIAFLLIIYSHLTSVGISNYGIKKMFPRLIIAAIIVNISYFICALAVDMSNILGTAFQNIFMGIWENSFQMTNNSANSAALTWEQVTAFVLSGGTIGTIGLAVSTGGNIVAAVFGLVPILVGAASIAIVTVIILVVRQALIVLLVVISPLAFVAYLLPNTDDWFKRWRSLFITMMIFFPAFALVFGGSQLAGAIIIQNASSIIMVILGMAVQIAPLAIVPLILKLGGSLLSRIAGIVNDPSKGLIDRTKNWAGKHQNYYKQRGLNGNFAYGKNSKKRSIFNPTGLAQRLNASARNLEENTKVAETEASNLYHETPGYEKIHEAAHRAEGDKKIIENAHASHIQHKVNSVGSDLHIQNAQIEAGKAGLEVANSETAAQIAEYKSGRVVHTGELGLAIDALKRSTIDQSAEQKRAASAESEVTANIASAYQNSVDLRMRAGGVQGQTGAERALASAISAQVKAKGESIANATTIIDAGNYTEDQKLALTLNNASDTGITVTEDIREAAIKMVASGKNTGQIDQMLRNLDINQLTEDQAQTLGDTIISNSNKPVYMGAGFVEQIRQRQVENNGDKRVRDWIIGKIADDSYGSAQVLVSEDKDYLAPVFNAINTLSDTEKSTYAPQLEKIKQQLVVASTDNRFSGAVGKRKNVLQQMYGALPGTTYSDSSGKTKAFPGNILE